ncbi:unnamed protein product [Gongylonema pulchrum]|uniref:Peptidase S1 domain-containing protein n=1 Tax=Gongylonema pulchrum TaxID=637853 RepID=A0A183D386_9BILA|nr:unnamed protein product [Gongylonema pulchrum]
MNVTFGKVVLEGDSGGGLMAQLDDGRWVLIGINSLSGPCAELFRREQSPAIQVHTNVALYAADIARFTGFLLPLVQ